MTSTVPPQPPKTQAAAAAAAAPATRYGQIDRFGRSKIEPSERGFTLGSLVARPHLKQMSALSAMSVPQLVQRMPKRYCTT